MTDFGQDISCVSDFTPHMQMASGPRLVAEAVARRLQTPRGGLLDDSTYGYDLTAELNNDLSPSDLGRISSGVSAEAQKDARVRTASTKVTLDGIGKLKVEISLTTQAGPFKLTLAVTAVTVSILSVGQ